MINLTQLNNSNNHHMIFLPFFFVFSCWTILYFVVEFYHIFQHKLNMGWFVAHIATTYTTWSLSQVTMLPHTTQLMFTWELKAPSQLIICFRQPTLVYFHNRYIETYLKLYIFICFLTIFEILCIVHCNV
jgi:hypothetical protein